MASERLYWLAQKMSLGATYFFSQRFSTSTSFGQQSQRFPTRRRSRVVGAVFGNPYVVACLRINYKNISRHLPITHSSQTHSLLHSLHPLSAELFTSIERQYVCWRCLHSLRRPGPSHSPISVLGRRSGHIFLLFGCSSQTQPAHRYTLESS